VSETEMDVRGERNKDKGGKNVEEQRKRNRKEFVNAGHKGSQKEVG
jgi:hypothetical protein